MLFYKVDCGGGGGGGGNQEDPLSTKIKIEIDYAGSDLKPPTCSLSEAFSRMGGNNYGKNNFWEIEDEDFFFIPETIIIDYNDSLVFKHITKRESILSNGDSWYIYLCGVKRIYNQYRRSFIGGKAYPDSGAAIVACFYLDSVSGYGEDGAWRKAQAVMHEIGHLLGRRGHCDSWDFNRGICVMYAYPHDWMHDFCGLCKDSIKNFYLPKIYRRMPQYGMK
ncbi:MAG: hypothetical protein ABIK76_04590 [candidate division WOR-3 bacterium]